MQTAKELTCKRCGWKWAPRVDGRPKCCPGCKSSRWDEAKRRAM
jgi:predicted Zn-ribbon and HTH transcriptional regulator